MLSDPRARLISLLDRANALLDRIVGAAVKATVVYTSQYESQLKKLIDDALAGKLTESEFKKKHKALIVLYAPEVFRTALLDQGLSDDEIEAIMEDEQPIIDQWIDDQTNALAGFAGAVLALAAIVALGGAFPTVQYNQLIDRADLWIDSMTWLSQMGKSAAKGDPYFYFDGDDGLESCDTCQALKGRREKRSWWISSGYIQRPNELFECGRFDPCHHHYYYDGGILAVN